MPMRTLCRRVSVPKKQETRCTKRTIMNIEDASFSDVKRTYSDNVKIKRKGVKNKTECRNRKCEFAKVMLSDFLEEYLT